MINGTCLALPRARCLDSYITVANALCINVSEAGTRSQIIKKVVEKLSDMMGAGKRARYNKERALLPNTEPHTRNQERPSGRSVCTDSRSQCKLGRKCIRHLHKGDGNQE